jgi:signal transduction histidine kinase
VAHDFNNLLTVILGQSEMILLQAAAAASVGNAEQIRSAAARRLAGAPAARVRSETRGVEPIDLNSVVEAIEPMLRRLIGEDIELHTTRAGNPRSYLTDRGHLDQVILNLALNARRHAFGRTPARRGRARRRQLPGSRDGRSRPRRVPWRSSP